MIWIISDTHFGHENIVKYANRPFVSVNKMDEKMTENWNNLINKTDTVYHLGDFALGLTDEKYRELIKSLNGEITLIRGNHDKIGKDKLIKLGFKNVVNRVQFGKYILTHKPIKPENFLINTINIHGHVHNNGYPECIADTSNYINACVDVWEFNPICFCKLMENDY